MNKEIDLARVRPLPPGIPALPGGWLNAIEARILYTAVRQLEGKHSASVLEIGSWIGRSSCCLAYGVRDCEGTRPRYDIVDYGIAGDAEWQSRFGNSLFFHKDAGKLAEVVFFPGGTGALLKKHLVDRDLSKYVTLIILGDLIDYSVNTKYDFIFCDATHDELEIRKNIPIIKGLLKDNFLLVCDDIARKEEQELVSSLIESDQSYLSSDIDKTSKFGIFTRGQAFKDFLG